MEPKITSKLQSDDCYYFFSLMTDRFKPINDIWAARLGERFGKKFKPIYILPFRHNKKFPDENYIVLNEGLAKTHKKLQRQDVINLIYPEDLNRQFSQSQLVANIIDKLAEKQGRVFVLSFTSVWLDIANDKVTILGPDSRVAAYFDDKTRHVETFEKLGFSTNKTTVYANFNELKKHDKYPFFVSATYSSGGIESKAIYTEADLEQFHAGLRPINKRQPFIAAKLLQDIEHAPNSSALVTGENQTTLVCVSDQILRNNQYMGNVFPSQVSSAHNKAVQEMTIVTGNYLSKKGFRGLFGMDFLITRSGGCYPVDLNPRRQGGYFCNVVASPTDIVDLELRLVLGEKLPHITYEDFVSKYCWAHSKLTPYFPNMRIVEEVKDGHPLDPFTDVGSTHKAIYYPKDHTVLAGNPGFYVTSSNSLNGLKQRLYQETEEVISKSYELYEG